MSLAFRIAAAGALGLAGAALAPGDPLARTPEARVATLLGPELPVGAGTARTFVVRGRDGAPTAVGVSLTESALTGLAPRMNTTSRCFDKNHDGRHSHGECLGDYQSTLALPKGADHLGLPVRWVTVNWNPEGHLPPAPPVWSAPHFDFHFFLVEPALIESIRTGPCAEFIHCDDFARASKPLAAEQLPEGYIDVGAAVAGMGNHLVDSQDPELADPSLGFSRTFIYGTYDGKMIFLEPMVSHAFLRSRPNQCTPIRAPRAYGAPGYYPTRYCVRHDAGTATYRVTLEGLVYRDG